MSKELQANKENYFKWLIISLEGGAFSIPFCVFVGFLIGIIYNRIDEGDWDILSK
ncbi:13768_t:CDS:1, partial [Gigaspora margarita]